MCKTFVSGLRDAFDLVNGAAKPSACRGLYLGYIVVGYAAQTVSLLFEQEAAKRSKNGVEIFRACGRDESYAPSTCANF